MIPLNAQFGFSNPERWTLRVGSKPEGRSPKPRNPGLFNISWIRGAALFGQKRNDSINLREFDETAQYGSFPHLPDQSHISQVTEMMWQRRIGYVQNISDFTDRHAGIAGPHQLTHDF